MVGDNMSKTISASYEYYETEEFSILDKKQEKFEKGTISFIDQIYFELGLENSIYDSETILGEFYDVVDNYLGLEIKNRGNNLNKSKILNRNTMQRFTNKTNEKKALKDLYERRDGVMNLERDKDTAALKFLNSSRERVQEKYNQFVDQKSNKENTLSMVDIRVLLNSRLKQDGITLSQQVLKDRNEARA